jgi:hypothetical protein
MFEEFKDLGFGSKVLISIGVLWILKHLFDFGFNFTF